MTSIRLERVGNLDNQERQQFSLLGCMWISHWRTFSKVSASPGCRTSGFCNTQPSCNMYHQKKKPGQQNSSSSELHSASVTSMTTIQKHCMQTEYSFVLEKRSPNTKTPGQHYRNKWQVRNKGISNIQIMYRFFSIKWVHRDILNKKLARDWGEGGWVWSVGEKLYKVTNITFTTHTRLCNCMLKFTISVTQSHTILNCHIQGSTFNQARAGNCPGAQLLTITQQVVAVMAT